MSQTILLDRCKLESQLIAGAAARWNNEANTPGIQEIDQVLQVCLDLPVHLRQAEAGLWDLAAAGQVLSFQETGQALLAEVDEAQRLIGGLAGRVEGAEAERLAAARAELEQLRQDHLQRWPWFDQKDVDQARVDAARGEGVELTAAFAEVAGVGPDEMRRRLEVHKQRRQALGWK